jgi:hypothetical protein
VWRHRRSAGPLDAAGCEGARRHRGQRRASFRLCLRGRRSSDRQRANAITSISAPPSRSSCADDCMRTHAKHALSNREREEAVALLIAGARSQQSRRTPTWLVRHVSSTATRSSSIVSTFACKGSTRPRRIRRARHTDRNGHADGPAEWLKEYLCGRQVECVCHARDRYGLLLAVCYVGGEDLNERIVRQGWGSTTASTRPTTCRRNQRPSAPAQASGAASSPHRGSGGPPAADADRLWFGQDRTRAHVLLHPLTTSSAVSG